MHGNYVLKKIHVYTQVETVFDQLWCRKYKKVYFFAYDITIYSITNIRNVVMKNIKKENFATYIY